MEELLRMNCIPIINANDVVTSPPGPEVDLTGVKILFAFFNLGFVDLGWKLMRLILGYISFFKVLMGFAMFFPM